MIHTDILPIVDEFRKAADLEHIVGLLRSREVNKGVSSFAVSSLIGNPVIEVSGEISKLDEQTSYTLRGRITADISGGTMEFLTDKTQPLTDKNSALNNASMISDQLKELAAAINLATYHGTQTTSGLISGNPSPSVNACKVHDEIPLRPLIKEGVSSLNNVFKRMLEFGYVDDVTMCYGSHVRRNDVTALIKTSLLKTPVKVDFEHNAIKSSRRMANKNIWNVTTAFENTLTKDLAGEFVINFAKPIDVSIPVPDLMMNILKVLGTSRAYIAG